METVDRANVDNGNRCIAGFCYPLYSLKFNNTRIGLLVYRGYIKFYTNKNSIN